MSAAIPGPATARPEPRHPDPQPTPRLVTRSRRPVSALVTTFNVAGKLAECLQSLTWCDEVMVVDSHSTDETVAIARAFDNVRVLTRTYYGAASQKNWAIDRLRHDWVLIVDADERVSPALRREIEGLLASSAPPSACTIPRRTYALGRRIRFSGWQNDRVTRFFRRDAARYPNRRVHADMVTAEEPVKLSESLDHEMVDDLVEYTHRLGRYAWWGAAQRWRDGHRTGAAAVIARPCWRFLRTYALQLGILEGARGLVMCSLQAYGVFVKYAILWSWQKNAGRGVMPRLPEFDDDEATWAWPR